MGDSVLVDIGGALGMIYFLLSGAIKARDERDRRRQKSNGGTPMDKLIRETRLLRKAVTAQNEELSKIADASGKQVKLLEDAEEVHMAMARVLNKLNERTAVLLAKDVGGRG